MVTMVGSSEVDLDRVGDRGGQLAVEKWRHSMEAAQRLEAGPPGNSEKGGGVLGIGANHGGEDLAVGLQTQANWNPQGWWRTGLKRQAVLEVPSQQMMEGTWREVHNVIVDQAVACPVV